ncbi:MAG: hypothetical protein QM764_22320 [Chitinophagaceae bacterium]
MGKLFCFLSAALLVTACNNSKPVNNVKNATDPEPGKMIVVLCDVSNSLSRRSVAGKPELKSKLPQIKDYCRQILRSAGGGTRVIFYPVSSLVAPDKLCDFRANQVNENQWPGEKERIKKACNQLDSLIDSAAANAERSTCLQTSINHAYTILRTERQSNPANAGPELYVISDMFEECSESKNGDVHMHTEDGAPLLKELVLKRLLSASQNADFDKYNIGLTILYVSTSSKPAVTDTIDSVWRVVFTNMHFAKAADQQTTLLKTDVALKPRKEYRNREE